jgi:flagellar biosynthetic protein FlhB
VSIRSRSSRTRRSRALHAAVKIDQAIPIEHHKPVAEVIGYVMRLRRSVARKPS